MAKHGLVKGLVTFTAAAAAVSGICYLFKDDIKGTKTYQDLNDKYDVDAKIKTATSKAKETASDLKDKAVELKDKASEKAPWNAPKDEDIEDDEIVLDEAVSEERDYVSLDDVTPEATEAPETLELN